MDLISSLRADTPSRVSPLRGFRATPTNAFTLTELLVCITIILIVMALAVPVASRIMAGAKTAKCTQNIRQLLLACRSFSEDHDGDMPYAHYAGWGPNGEDWRGNGQRLFHCEIFPYLGYTNWDSAYFVALAANTVKLPDVFRCPSDTIWPPWGIESTSYGYNWRLGKRIPEDYPAGTTRRKYVAVARPSEMILIADSPKQAEAALGGGFNIGPLAVATPVLPSMKRHKERGNIGWLDGHVSSENAVGLTNLYKEAPPWPHWVP